ncbi:MAG: EF-P beta-lysylation protein EpmB [Thiogranum sp.]|nr:EF-P beta-lysylation protein EpmB [Thiogranum sp.]
MPMITRSQHVQQPTRWQSLLADAITDPARLLEALELSPELLPQAIRASASFRLKVPRSFIARMVKQDLDDPLLRQVLPLGDELAENTGFSLDPLSERESMPVPGLLHKYQGRILLTMTGACAVHCRYCFRRHYPYTEANPAREHWRSSLDYLRQNTRITEVILSGGDPLTLSDQRLGSLVADLGTLAQLETLRIHTRVPVVLPERVVPELLDWIAATPLNVVIVIHCNHANEIDGHVIEAMRALRAAGATLLNQSVLLRGVNDDSDSLVNLSKRLLEAGVLPYYLHQLDRVQGAAHFSVSDTRAKQLLDAMRDRLPGYLLPRLVREEPHKSAKTPL